ncbi:MAG: FHA domain-containing protein, partial [Mycobacteriales bacterium]
RGPSSPALVALSVVGGPDAGTTHPLRRGRVVVGRDDTADVVVADPDLSRRHLALEIGSDAVRVADLGSTNGTRLDGCPLGAGLTDLPAGASLRAGESTLRIGAPERRQAACRPRDDGTVVVNRPPRITPAGPRSTVRFPTPPDRRSAGRLPVIAALAPLVMGVGMAVVMHSPQYLAFAVLSPVMLVGNAISERLGLRKGRRHEATAYRRDLADATAALAEALAASRRRTHAAAPDPATIARTALTPSHRLWERRRADADFLRVRIGTGDRPADVAVEGPVDAAALTARQVPVSIDLAGTVGVAVPRPPVDALLRSLVCQLGCLHGPSDLQIAMLGSRARRRGGSGRGGYRTSVGRAPRRPHSDRDRSRHSRVTSPPPSSAERRVSPVIGVHGPANGWSSCWTAPPRWCRLRHCWRCCVPDRRWASMLSASNARRCGCPRSAGRRSTLAARPAPGCGCDRPMPRA